MKLIAFIPCEKVILNKEDNNTSLITVLTEIAGEYQLVPGAKQERDDTFPYRWSVFTMWKFDPSETEHEFVQLIKFRSPSGYYIPTAKNPVVFKSDKPIHRVVTNVGAIPIGESGDWTIELYAAKKDTSLPEQPLATYPLKIHFKETKPAETTASGASS